MVEVKFTKAQFESLMKLVSTATWVINAFKKEAIEEFAELEQYLYSIAEDEGFTDLYEYDEVSESFGPSEEVEDEIQEHIAEYNDEIFWQTLCTRLAIRDLEKELGESTVQNMKFDERVKRIAPIFDKYAEEFVKNGVDNLVLIKKK